MEQIASPYFTGFVLMIFLVGYYFIVMEERYKINKAETSMLMGTLIFLAIGIYGAFSGYRFEELPKEVNESLQETLSLVFFLWISMIFIEFFTERGLFDVLNAWLVSKQMTYRAIYWFVGLMSFFLSSVVNNLTTALVMATVILTVGKGHKNFLIVSAINIVVASNAGGVWCAFGDVTSLMAWNAGKVTFWEFFMLMPAAFIGWFVTALLMLPKVPKGKPKMEEGSTKVKLKEGGGAGIVMGVLALVLSVLGQSSFGLPSVWGMLTGFAFLLMYGAIKRNSGVFSGDKTHAYRFVKNVDFQTLFFFIGILSAVEGLHFMGLLDVFVGFYDKYDPNVVNIMMGLLSAIVDNVPIMQAILSIDPDMNRGQWLSLVLSEGIGGSLLIFGSAAGVAIMGKMHDVYNFRAHLKYSWAIAVGYFLTMFLWIVQLSFFPVI